MAGLAGLYHSILIVRNNSASLLARISREENEKMFIIVIKIGANACEDVSKAFCHVSIIWMTFVVTYTYCAYADG